MVKHNQTICRQIGNELFERVWPFCGVDVWKVKFHKVCFEKNFSADFFLETHWV